MASEAGSIREEECNRTIELLHHTMKENMQKIANQMKKCSDILGDLAEGMDCVSKSIHIVQEDPVFINNATPPEETMPHDK